MKRTLEDIRENLGYVGCDCDEIERLRRGEDLFPVFDTIDRLLDSGHSIAKEDCRKCLREESGKIVTWGETFRELCVNIVFMGL